MREIMTAGKPVSDPAVPGAVGRARRSRQDVWYLAARCGP